MCRKTRSESKTVTMFLKGSGVETRYPRICMHGGCLKYVKCVKYLGIWLSEKISFKMHLKKLRNKCGNVVGKLRRVTRTEWGELCIGFTRVCLLRV